VSSDLFWLAEKSLLSGLDSKLLTSRHGDRGRLMAISHQRYLWLTVERPGGILPNPR
jgi:hypothetical protein